MLMIQVGLSAPKAAKLLKIFDEITNGVFDDVSAESLTDKKKDFLDKMVDEGFVSCFVADWGNQEEAYRLTNIGRDILRIKNKKQ